MTARVEAERAIADVLESHRPFGLPYMGRGWVGACTACEWSGDEGHLHLADAYADHRRALLTDEGDNQ